MSLKVIQHSILQDLIATSQGLGRAPTRLEYQDKGKYTTLDIIEAFGSYANLITAANLGKKQKKTSKEDNKKKAFEHLKVEIAQRVPRMPLIASKLLVIGDLHIPYQHPDAIDFIIALNRKYKFDLVTSVGDECDFHAISFHDADKDLLSPGHELEASIKELKKLYDEFPRMIIAESNHGSLLTRKMKHHGLPIRALKSYREILEAPIGWEWRFEIQVQFPMGGKCIIHHSYGANVLAMSRKRGGSLIQGHHHNSQGIQKWRNADEVFFAAFTGCLIDADSLAMAYGRNNLERPMLGCLAVLDGEPKILPMNLDSEGRWTKVIP